MLWVEALSGTGRWGRVELPYVWPRSEGWIRLARLERATTWVRVDGRPVRSQGARLQARSARLEGARARRGRRRRRHPPVGYVVTDRVPFAAGSSLGSFAFGISGIQPRLPAGWSGGDQLAIHGTNQPWSIGRSASAGCVRVSERALDRLGAAAAAGHAGRDPTLSRAPTPSGPVEVHEGHEVLDVGLVVTEGVTRPHEDLAESLTERDATASRSRGAPAGRRHFTDRGQQLRVGGRRAAERFGP